MRKDQYSIDHAILICDTWRSRHGFQEQTDGLIGRLALLENWAEIVPVGRIDPTSISTHQTKELLKI